jgi:hypothetical protein
MQFDSIPEIQSTQEVKGLTPELFKVQVPWDYNVTHRTVYGQDIRKKSYSPGWELG